MVTIIEQTADQIGGSEFVQVMVGPGGSAYDLRHGWERDLTQCPVQPFALAVVEIVPAADASQRATAERDDERLAASAHQERPL